MVQAYVLKQMAVSPRAKYADWRYNKYSLDFDETKSQQDQKYWKYLHPILLDMKSSRQKTGGLNSLFHFKETESPTAKSLYALAEKMEIYSFIRKYHRGREGGFKFVQTKWGALSKRRYV